MRIELRPRPMKKGDCVRQENYYAGGGVECHDLSRCNKCGWNPAVAKKRIEKWKEKLNGR
jgi:hypothetical protein